MNKTFKIFFPTFENFSNTRFFVFRTKNCNFLFFRKTKNCNPSFIDNKKYKKYEHCCWRNTDFFWQHHTWDSNKIALDKFLAVANLKTFNFSFNFSSTSFPSKKFIIMYVSLLENMICSLSNKGIASNNKMYQKLKQKKLKYVYRKDLENLLFWYYFRF